MILNPLDIQKKVFAKNFRGFDEVEVEGFLEEVAAYCTGLVKENNELKDKMRSQEIRISELVDREKTVNTTLSVVRKLSDEMKDTAKKQGETIVSQAKSRAKEIYVRLQDEANGLKTEIAQYKQKKAESKSALVQYLKNQIALIEGPGADTVESIATISTEKIVKKSLNKIASESLLDH